MNHEIRLILLCACALGMLPVRAEDTHEGGVEELDAMVISSPLHKKAAETAHPVTVLTGDDLRIKASSTIGETLSQEAGIHSSSFGPGVGQPVIRGQSGPRVKVLQNNLGSLDVSSLSPDHANSTEAFLAERIEVLRGPATLLYGSGAIGGVVNVIDNRIPEGVPDKLFEGALEQRWNTVSDEWTSAFKLDGGKGPLAWHLDGFLRERNNVKIPGHAIDESAEAASHGDVGHDEGIFNTKGFIANTDARAKSGTAGVSLVGERGFAGVSVNYLENKYGIPPGAHDHEEDHDDDDDDHHDDDEERVRIRMKQARYDFKGELKDPFLFAEALRVRVGYNDYEHVELEDGEVGTRFKNKGVDSRLELTHKPWAFFDHGVVGVQAASSKFSATGEEAFVPVSDILSYGFFTLQDIHAGDWIFEFGLRVEDQTIDPKGLKSRSHTPVSASASALWNVFDDSVLSLAFSRSQRAPEVQELFSNGPHLATGSFEVGNDRLVEETAHNLELGFRFDQPWVSGEINLFHNWIDDYIFQANTGDFMEDLPVFQATQRNAIFRGFEAEVTAPLVQSNYGNLDLTLFGDYVRGEFKGGGDVPRLPPLRYGAQLTFAHLDWRLNVRATRGERQNRPGENETETDGYVLLNAGFDYHIPLGHGTDLLLFAKGRNLLNEEIRNSTSFLRNFAPEPGRGAELGLRVSF